VERADCLAAEFGSLASRNAFARWALRLLGETHLAAGRPDAAADHHRRALDIARQSGYPLNQAQALVGLGAALHRTGDEYTAREHWREALAIFEQLGDPQADDVRVRLIGV
jgi:tetratricopeptide (TPR) repeat protein